MPKSASTYFAELLVRSTGFLLYNLDYNHLNEQDLYLPRLVDSWPMDIVSHHHTRATRENLRLTGPLTKSGVSDSV